MRSLLREALYVLTGALAIFLVSHFVTGQLLHRNRSPLRIGSDATAFKLPRFAEDRAYVLVVSSDDHYSIESLEFHKKLVNLARDRQIPLWVIVPNRSAASWYETHLPLSSPRILIRNFGKVGVVGTPTIVMVDHSQTVVGLWTGLMPQGNQTALLVHAETTDHTITTPTLRNAISIPREGVKDIHVRMGSKDLILNQLQRQDEGNRGAAPIRVVTTTQFGQEAKDSQIIDVRSPSDFKQQALEGATNIPLDQLNIRAPLELKSDRPILVDCARTQTSVCDLSGAALLLLGFTRVGLVDRGMHEIACKITPVL